MKQEARFPAWAWWIIGAVSILAISILIFSVVLGIRAGQQQVEIQRRQQIGIALQAAIDAQAAGSLQAAFDAYQKVLVLDPSNEVAKEGVKNLLTLAQDGTQLSGGGAAQVAAQAPAPQTTPAAEAASAGAMTTAVTAGNTATTPATPAGGAGTATPTSPAASNWQAAQTAAGAGRWQEAINQLSLVQSADPAFRTTDVANLLFQSYVSLAGEKEQGDNLEEALQAYDQALLLRPDAMDVQRARTLVASYQDVLTYSDADWPRAIELLEKIYADNPQYRDVEERLQDAHATYGDQLAAEGQWCVALTEYESGLSVRNQPDLLQKRDAAQVQCDQVGNLAAGTTPDAGGRITGTAGATTTAATTAGAAASAGTAALPAGSDDGPAIGRILYSTKDPVASHYNIMEQGVGTGAAAQLLLQDATQPAMRADGARLAFRNLRSNMAGISSFDPDTGLMLRFSEYAEDGMPSWNPQGSRIAIASNREGDRRWRIYLVWAEQNGGVDTLGYGEAPAWSPVSDQIVFRGCDPSGNNCGLWTASGSGTNRAALTTVPDDNRPQWSPDGSFVVFMNSSRNGNFDIFRVETLTGQVTRLTNNAGADVLPVVSPDGAWVAYASNRDGGWKLVAQPSDGGQEYVIAPITGDIGDWSAHGMQWTY